jgi:xanthine dehydrogenase YagR molybdenum-binding subunit
LPVSKIDVVLGDTRLPSGPISGGSWVTATVTPAVLQATQAAVKVLLQTAVKAPSSPFAGKKAEDLELVDGAVQVKNQASIRASQADVLRMANIKAVSGDAKSEGNMGGPSDYSFHSFGAQFVEVTWQPEIARMRVNRVVTVIDAGRMLNPLPARNQIEGAVVMGVGMAMFENTEYDQRSGAPINSNLADYVMAVNADCPKIDVTFLDHPDYHLNALGARGVGEIGLAGMASAITAAAYHATGIRVRNLPIRIEDLLATPAAALHQA